jgi:predicted  nucleic acid-binding Zn-ribbon protein
MTDDITHKILREIRDEITTTRSELVTTRTELGARIDVTNQRLQVVETTLQDLAAQQLPLTRYVKNVVDRHETSIDDLRERVVRLETKLGT